MVRDMSEERNHGHGSVKLHGIDARFYFKFSERADGQFDWTSACDKGFTVHVKREVLESISAVASKIGRLGKEEVFEDV